MGPVGAWSNGRWGPSVERALSALGLANKTGALAGAERGAGGLELALNAGGGTVPLGPLRSGPRRRGACQAAGRAGRAAKGVGMCGVWGDD